jgi:Secretion system C-terminal sorting domain/SprB repeat
MPDLNAFFFLKIFILLLKALNIIVLNYFLKKVVYLQHFVVKIRLYICNYSISLIKTNRMKPFFTSLLALFCSFLANAQCSTINVVSSNVSPAACPDGGSITINATGNALVYRFLSGPTNYNTSPNSTGLFNSLSAGNYQVEIKDACNITTTRNYSVANTYPTFSVSANATNVCSGGQNAQINVSVTGGKPPYQYDVVPAASTPVYGAAIASTSFQKSVTVFGVHRAYVKDACGEVRTVDINVLRTQPTPEDMVWEPLIMDRPCNETMDGLPTISWALNFTANGDYVNFNNLIGSTWQIYKPNPANSITYSQTNGNCSNNLGVLLNSGTITAAGITNPYEPNYYNVTIPQQDVILKFTTQCGDVMWYCLDFNGGQPLQSYVKTGIMQQACSASGWNSQTFDIETQYDVNMTAPINYVITKNGGSTESNAYGDFFGLVPSNFPINFVATDACGRQYTQTFTLPTQGSALSATMDPVYDFVCSNVQNVSSVSIRINGGDLPGIGEATNIVVTGGPSNIAASITDFQNWIPGYILSNAVPGYSYKILITNNCGEKDSIQFTVPINNWDVPTLTWNLTASVDALCGQNKSNIIANANLSGTTSPTYSLYQLTAPNTVLAQNQSGIFTNINPGQYKVVFNGNTSNQYMCPNATAKDSVNVTVVPDGTAIAVTRKTVVNCEDSQGNPLQTGKAIIEVNGSAPYDYEIIKQSLVGTGATEVWTVSSANNSSNTYTWNLPLPGDPANTMYVLRSTDKCGNKVTTQASLQPMGTPVLQSTQSPCVGNNNYTVSISQYGTGFTYKWYKLPNVTTVLSNTNELVFAGAYNTSYNGTYRCVVEYAGCITRTKEVTLNNNNCGGVLPIKFISLNARKQSGQVKIAFEVENELEALQYEIERSEDGNTFTKNGTVSALNNGFATYTHIDVTNTSKGRIYYRIKAIEKTGAAAYSKVVFVDDNKENELQISAYPNPTKATAALSIQANAKGIANVRLADITGKIIFSNNYTTTIGNNVIHLQTMENLTAGTYFVTVSLNNEIKHIKLQKY